MNQLANKWVTEWLEGLGRFTLLTWETAVSIFKLRITLRDLIYQMHFIGVRSQSVVLITGAFTGMVLAAQTYIQFHKIKMDTATLAVVGVSMCSELGPVLTGLMVAGRVGAAIAAELGTMRVTEQIDALRTLATHPVDYLVVPRVVAAHIVMPILVIESIVMGIGSGYLLCIYVLDIDSTYVWSHMVKYTGMVDVMIGITKGFVYGGLLAMIGCYKGMSCGEGAEGVGQATTEAVVYASISILISNLFLTLIIGKLLNLL